YYRVVALNGAVEANPSPTIFTAAPAAVALPKPWTAADVGSVLGEGATGLQSGKFILVGSGTAIGGAADSFRYTSQPLIGDGTIVATVSSLENTGSWAKGAVVIRESLDPNARQAVMALSADNGIVWQYRQNIGGSGVVVAGPTSQTAPVWLKVTRSGNSFTGSWSSDGTTWTQAGTITIPMSATALVGLASTSDAAARLNRVEFTNVTVSNLAPTVATAAAATGIVTGATSPLTVLGADDHGEANLDYRWTAQGPAAVTFSANGTNAAKSSVATFTKAGGYVLTATITDSSGLTTTSTVSVTVVQTPTTITVSPPTASIVAGTTLQLAAAAADQFGIQMSTQPAFTWAATGGGSITPAGLFTAAVSPATATIRASASSVVGQATVTITTADQVVSVPSGQRVVEAGGRSGVGALVKRGTGTLVLDGTNTHAGGTVVEQGELVIRNVAALGSGRLEVRAGGRVSLDVAFGTVAVPALVLDPAGRFDIGTGRLTVAAGLGESTVRQLLIDGHNGGGWDGTRGIVSRAMAPGRAVGYVVDQGQVTVAYAAPGDTNLDGVVDIVDVADMAANFGASGPADARWSSGDFTYDLAIDELDMSEFLAAAVFDQGAYLSASDAAWAALGREEAQG
ncbi:MAG: autotransporter-associated beta strand repeat-containing protein, partial [Planctomycetaceae bacterium]